MAPAQDWAHKKPAVAGGFSLKGSGLSGFSGLARLDLARLGDQVVGDLERTPHVLRQRTRGEVTPAHAEGRHAVHLVAVLQLRGLARLGADGKRVVHLDK